MPEESLKRIESQLRWLQYVTAGAVGLSLLIVTIVMLFTMWNTYRLGGQAAEIRAVTVETHDVLCALYNREVQANIDAEKILKDSPKGLLTEDGTVAISAALIQRGIDQRTETIQAMRLAGLDCDGEVIT